MQRNLRTGAIVMRYFQIFSLILALCGSGYAWSIMQGEVDPEMVVFVRTVFVLFFFVSLMLAVSVWMLSRRNLAKRINVLSGTLKRVTTGDLTARVQVDSDDEMGQLGLNLNTMLDKFESLIISISSIASELTDISRHNSEAANSVVAAAQIQSEGVEKTSNAVNGIIGSVDKVSEGVINLTGSAEVNSASIAEISTSISDVHKSVNVQSESIDEVSSAVVEMAAVMEQISANVRSLMEASVNTTSSVAEMDATTRQVEENVRETASISAEVLQDAEQGRAAVEATITGINEIRSSSGRTFSSINLLSERVAAIGSILSVIDEIAEQTNLLALNSAIIAAQAGEHGKGFAIVAGEIKGLANRTRQSTMEIASLIEAVQAETAKASAAIRQTEERVQEGEQLSRRSGDALGKILSGVQMASARVNEIARATVEQSQGGQLIHGAMRHVADMVAQIARSCQESAKTNSSIMTAVERMKGFTSQVNSSASRQQKIGEEIARSTEHMAYGIADIKDSCSEQSLWSMQIHESIASVRESTESNLQSAKIMGKGVENLLSQINMLKKEIRQLQISERTGEI
ncbi:MAG: HAMP domain-containing protein [Geobacteraceae bacterium]|nr:HAMP domain-containing protein [Geobacteraceae bacterium]